MQTATKNFVMKPGDSLRGHITSVTILWFTRRHGEVTAEYLGGMPVVVEGKEPIGGVSFPKESNR